VSVGEGSYLMSSVLVSPDVLGAAAQDVAGIGSDLSVAHTAAAAQTTGVLAAAEDEVSAAIAAVFSAHGQGFQALGVQAAAFQEQFVQALTAGARSYVSAEAANVAAFMANPAKTLEQDLLNVINAPTLPSPAATIGLVIGASGIPIPGPTYVQLANEIYLHLNPLTDFPNPYANGLFTPAYGLLSVPFSWNYPTATTGPLAGFPAPFTSVGQGMLILDNAILSNLAVVPTPTTSTVFGWSQSATISGLVMKQLSQPPFSVPNNLLNFVLVGDPNAPNGGIAERFFGLTLPSVGLQADGYTPQNLYPTRIYTLEYDGIADFPRYPIDVLSDLNAGFGYLETHGLYLSIPSTVDVNAMPLMQSGAPSMTNYYMIPLSVFPPGSPESYLPLLQPLLGVPVVGKPLADLLQPILTPLVNWGYGDPNFGWSTSPADVPTQIGFLPPLSATTALGPLLVSGTQQGVHAFVSDLHNLSLSALVPAASPPSLPSLMNLLPALSTAASDPGAILTNVVNAFSSAGASVSALGLQTADLLNAAVTSIPAYDVSLFLANLSNPVDAIGLPIAADVGLYTVGGLLEAALVEQAIGAIINDFLGLIP
jgi:hypothetical protein